jgi:hypothetical protein
MFEILAENVIIHSFKDIKNSKMSKEPDILGNAISEENFRQHFRGNTHVVE